MVTPKEVLNRVVDVQMGVNLAKALAHEALAFAEICEERDYKVAPAIAFTYVDRIKGVVRATKEQNNA